VRPHPRDQLAAVGGDGAPRQDGGNRLAVGLDRDPRQKLRRIGVESEANLTAALFDERRQPVSKLGQELSP
jgi:hypothetical protein